MNITKEEVQRLIEAFHADPHTADWDDALSLLRAKRDEKGAEPIGEVQLIQTGVHDEAQVRFHMYGSIPELGTKLYTHPAHDDTALLREALEALDDAQGYIEAELNDRMDLYKGYPNLAYKYESEQRSLQQNQEAITALRERLGEKA